MAARHGKRPARDSIQAARFAHDTAEGLMRVHRKVCGPCGRAGTDTRRLCDEGWALIKAVTRTGNRYRRLAELVAAQGEQGELW